MIKISIWRLSATSSFNVLIGAWDRAGWKTSWHTGASEKKNWTKQTFAAHQECMSCRIKRQDKFFRSFIIDRRFHFLCANYRLLLIPLFHQLKSVSVLIITSPRPKLALFIPIPTLCLWLLINLERRTFLGRLSLNSAHDEARSFHSTISF